VESRICSHGSTLKNPRYCDSTLPTGWHGG